MIRLDINNWYKLEGYIVPTAEYNYTTPITNLTGQDIWYTNVEVQLQNPTIGNYIHGVNYKTMTFADLGYTTIEAINANFSTAITQMTSKMASNEGALTYREPFIITRSSVICFGDSYSDSLPYYIVILKDDYLTASITGITAAYNGPSVQMNQEFNTEYLNISGYFNDGHTSMFDPGTYSIKRSDNIATKEVSVVGSNLYTASVVYGENTWTASFVVPGVKRLTGVTATYDGPAIAINKKPMKRNIIVIANYSDGSYSTVTDWTYENGDTITEINDGVLVVYYQGFTTTITINKYKASATQIKAFYNGPNVEVDKSFLMQYVTVKIYYQDVSGVNSYWEVLEQTQYTIDNTLIKFEGNNIINVSYTANSGDVITTNFLVTGFEPEKEIAYITAEYSGPPIVVGKSFSQNKVICKAFWTDNSVSQIINFNIGSTAIQVAGVNEFTVHYKESTCTFIVTGIAPDSTSEDGYSPTEVNLLYPEATRVNHRRRGPMESEKFDTYNLFAHKNITTLFDIYNSLEKTFKTICNDNQSLYNTGANTLNQCSIINDRIKTIKSL